MTKYDAIIIGGGHNGLVAAAYLAKAGRRVLVLERRSTLGGAAATEEVFPGFRLNTGAHDAGLFSDEIVHDLELTKQGLEFIESPVAAYAPQPDGPALTLWRDVVRSQDEIRHLSAADAAAYPKFVHDMHRYAGVLSGIRSLTPPQIKDTTISGGWPWLKPTLDLKKLGKRDMMEFLRVLPMSVREFLDDRFENEAMKGLLGSTGVIGSMQGPMAAGTVFVMLYYYMGELNGGFRASRFVRGGIGGLSAALAAVAREQGAEVRTETEVHHIDLDDATATGVTLTSGETVGAKVVLSNADPWQTFVNLVKAPNLGPEFVRKVRNIRFRGTTAKLNLVLNGLPEFVGNPETERLTGHIIICPSLEYLERAYDDAKYGSFSRQPYLDIVIPTLLDPTLAPESKHLLSIIMQYAPYHLESHDWVKQKPMLADTIIDTLSQYAPNLRDLIEHHQILTPADWESDYGLTEGSIFHGQMALDQLVLMRPLPGWGQYRTPIENLYLCGAGCHPGGGVTGDPGRNAARAVLKQLG